MDVLVYNDVVFTRRKATVWVCINCRTVHWAPWPHCGHCGGDLETKSTFHWWDVAPAPMAFQQGAGPAHPKRVARSRRVSLVAVAVVLVRAFAQELRQDAQELLSSFWQEALKRQLLICQGAEILHKGGVAFSWAGPLGNPEVVRQAVSAALTLGEYWKAIRQKTSARHLADALLQVGVSTGLHHAPAGAPIDPQAGWVAEAQALATQAPDGALICATGVRDIARSYYEFIGVPTYGVPSGTATGFICLGRRRPVSHALYDDLEGTPFVGRERELALMQDVLSRTLEGATQVVSLVGEPGMGKTRLIKEVLKAKGKALGQARALIARGYGVSYGSTPFGVVQGILSDLAAGAAGSECFPWVQKTERLAKLVEQDTTELSRRAHLVRRRRVRKESVALIQEIAGNRPLVVIADDLHWADSQSLQVLRHLIESIDSVPVLFILSFRLSLWKILPWHPRGDHAEILLHDLRPKEIDQLAEALLKARHLSPQLEKAVLAQALGNPLFMEHLVALVEEDPRFQHLEPVGLAEFQKPFLPETLHGVVLSRIALLGKRVRHLRRAAFWATIRWERENLVQEIGKLEQQVGAWLDRLEAWEYEGRRQIAQYLRQLNALDSELVLLSLLLGRARPRERRLLLALERLLTSCADEYLAALLEEHVRDASKDVAFEALQSADLLVSANRFREAKRFLELCLAEAGRSPSYHLRPSDILERLGDVTFRLGELQSSAQYYRNALEHSRSSPGSRGHDQPLQAVVWKQARVLRVLGKPQEAERVLTEHFQQVDSASPRAYYEFVLAKLDVGKGEQALTAARQAYQVAVRRGLSHGLGLAWAWCAEARAQALAGDQNRAEEAVAHMLAALPSAGWDEGTSEMVLTAARVLMKGSATVQAALQAAKELVKVARSIGAPIYLRTASQLLADAYERRQRLS